MSFVRMQTLPPRLRGALGVLIGRVFSRSPFPDEVHPVFAALKNRIRSKAGSTGPLGRMLDMVHELRVGTEDWEQRPLRLRVYLLVKQSNLILSEDADPNFALTSLEGMSPSESLEHLTLGRSCELLTLESQTDDARFHLWGIIARCFEEMLQPNLSVAVEAVEVEAISEAEFTYAQWRQTESLNLETVSESIR